MKQPQFLSLIFENVSAEKIEVDFLLNQLLSVDAKFVNIDKKLIVKVGQVNMPLKKWLSVLDDDFKPNVLIGKLLTGGKEVFDTQLIIKEPAEDNNAEKKSIILPWINGIKDFNGGQIEIGLHGYLTLNECTSFCFELPMQTKFELFFY